MTEHSWTHTHTALLEETKKEKCSDFIVENTPPHTHLELFCMFVQKII